MKNKEEAEKKEREAKDQLEKTKKDIETYLHHFPDKATPFKGPQPP